jgi:hypothetical protein
VDRWEDFWKLAKDIALTVAGLVLIITQVTSDHPKDALLVAGLALTGIGASFHVGELVSGYFGSPRSEPPSLDGAQPQGGSGEKKAAGRPDAGEAE